MFFSWKNEYSVGIDSIDLQHRYLINMINDLYMAIHENRGSEAIHPLFDSLQDYIRDHFNYEKKMMEDSEYAHRFEHLQEHDEFIARIAEMKAKHARGRLDRLQAARRHARFDPTAGRRGQGDSVDAKLVHGHAGRSRLLRGLSRATERYAASPARNGGHATAGRD